MTTPPDTTPQDPGLRVTVGDGKYTVIQEADGHLRALRYGEEWRDCTGDGLILALAHEVERLRAAGRAAYVYVVRGDNGGTDTAAVIAQLEAAHVV